MEQLDFHYAIIGQLVSGFDTFEKIMHRKVVLNSTTDEVASRRHAITVTSAQIITDTQDAVLELWAPASEDGNMAIDYGYSERYRRRDEPAGHSRFQIVTNTVTDPPFPGAVNNQITSRKYPGHFNADFD